MPALLSSATTAMGSEAAGRTASSMTHGLPRFARESACFLVWGACFGGLGIGDIAVEGKGRSSDKGKGSCVVEDRPLFVGATPSFVMPVRQRSPKAHSSHRHRLSNSTRDLVRVI